MKALTKLQEALAKASEGATLIELQAKDIHPYKHQIRTVFSVKADEELTASIKQHGVVQPVLVRISATHDHAYELIAGERRWRSAQAAGKPIPALVRHIDDEEAEALHRIENIHRENLSNLEIAKALKEDLVRLKNAGAVGKLWGKSPAWISKMLSLNDLGEATQSLVDENITGDKEVLAEVARLEKRDKAGAKLVVEKIKAAPPKAKVRELVKAAVKAATPKKTKTAKPRAPVKRWWKTSAPLERKGSALAIGVEIKKNSRLCEDFEENVSRFGDAMIATEWKHKNTAYIWVAFGKSRQVAEYPAEDLQLTYME